MKTLFTHVFCTEIRTRQCLYGWLCGSILVQVRLPSNNFFLSKKKPIDPVGGWTGSPPNIFLYQVKHLKSVIIGGIPLNASSPLKSPHPHSSPSSKNITSIKRYQQDDDPLPHEIRAIRSYAPLRIASHESCHILRFSIERRSSCSF